MATNVAQVAIATHLTCFTRNILHVGFAGGRVLLVQLQLNRCNKYAISKENYWARGRVKASRLEAAAKADAEGVYLNALAEASHGVFCTQKHALPVSAQLLPMADGWNWLPSKIVGLRRMLFKIADLFCKTGYNLFGGNASNSGILGRGSVVMFGETSVSCQFDESKCQNARRDGRRTRTLPQKCSLSNPWSALSLSDMTRISIFALIA